MGDDMTVSIQWLDKQRIYIVDIGLEKRVCMNSDEVVVFVKEKLMLIEGKK